VAFGSPRKQLHYLLHLFYNVYTVYAILV